MAQLAQMNVTMNAMQAQLNILSLAPINQTSTKRNNFWSIFGNNYTHGSKNWSAKKSYHKEEA